MKIKTYLFEYRGTLLALGGYLFITYLLWATHRFEAIGCNLFAGAVQLAFTFIVFERLIASQNERRDLPKKIWAYEDVRKWFDSMIWLYQAAYRRASGNVPPATIGGICHDDFFNQMLRLNLEDEGPMLPFRKWEQLLAEQTAEFIDTGHRILGRDGDKIPPDVGRAIHTTATGPFLEGGRALPTIRAVSNQYVAQGGGRAPIWLYNTPGISLDEIQALRTIHTWLIEFYDARSSTTQRLSCTTIRA